MRREAEVEARRRHARQSVLAAGPFRQRIELDEIEDLRDRHRDHREVDAGAAQRDQADEVADGRGGDHADHEREHHVRKAGAREQVGGDESAGAVERRLAEREQARVAEQDVEADAEEAPHQDAVHRVGRRAQVGQHEGRGDERDRGERLDQVGGVLVMPTRRAHSRPRVPSRPCGRTISTSVIAANSIT